MTNLGRVGKRTIFRRVALAMIAVAVCQDATAAADYSTFAREAPERLAQYLKINTQNPPGNEIRGAEFFAAVFDAAGIEYEIAESAPGRGNIWARQRAKRGADNKPALLLLNHMDVVPADLRYWTFDPFSGAIRDGYVWGRGALDMKGTGIAQLQAFLALHAAGGPLTRDVIFMATADEEAGGAYGAGWLVEQRPELFEGVGFLLNEGGSGSLMGKDVVYSVEVTQKVPLWLRLTARGRPGHGSTPQLSTAVTRILRAGDRLANTQFPPRLVPAVASLFEGLAPYQDAALQPRYADMASAIQDSEFMTYLQLTHPRQHALLRNTCSLTRLAGSDKINVVPAEATLELDCRLLPDQNPDQFIEDLAMIVNDPDIQIDKLMSFTPAMSRTDTALYDLIGTVARELHTAAKVVPGVSTGFTDSHFFRDLGIVSYGISGAVVPEEEARGVHGNDERIAVDNMIQAAHFMIELVARFAAH